MDERTDAHLDERHTWDPVDLKVASIVFREARRAYRYTPADERAERIAEEQADDLAAPGTGASRKDVL